MKFMQAIVLGQSFTLTRFRRFALPVLFVLFGLVSGTWASRIPALRDGLHLSHSMLSVVLLCAGVGSVLSFPISSRMMARHGGRKSMLYSGIALLVALLCIGAARSVTMLELAMLTLGVAASCFDVAMNSVATRYEETSGKSQLSKLHAWYCAGGLTGAALGSAMAGMHVRPFKHFSLLGCALAFVLWKSCDLLETDDAPKKAEKQSFALPRGPLILLGVLGFFGSVAEGSIADWSGIFLKDHFGVTDGFAPLALSVFSILMLMTRITGDRLKGSFSPRSLLGVGGLLGATGLFFAVLAPNAYFALGGFALAGLGMALVFPFVFSAAGKEGPIALAGVATMAYSGGLMGPPMLGAVAGHFGMQSAIAFIGVLSACSAVVAKKSSMLG
jgi:fucose permease